MTVQSTLPMQPNVTTARSCGCTSAPTAATAPPTSAPAKPAARSSQPATCPATNDLATLDHLALPRTCTPQPRSAPPRSTGHVTTSAVQIMQAALPLDAPHSADTPQLVRNLLRAVVGTTGEGRQSQLVTLAAPLRAPDAPQATPDDGRDIRALVGWAPISGAVTDPVSSPEADDAEKHAQVVFSWQRAIIRAAYLVALVLVPLLVTIVIVVATGR